MDERTQKRIPIEVAYALPEEQYLLTEEVAPGTTVEEALKQSELLKRFPDLDISQVGIFSQPVKPDHVLSPQDRIEVYRPLKADPRERRRKKVAQERQQSTEKS
ncbi:RnfH family protein [Thiomicrospira sp. WB1]|jgi:putative ubiquitin-RnfH superfamily antitoxin RatB of RatAB toxin-antitoxin module|uniref:RnfH family protein n=1 Tax=Thiomicrospira sp. WB1 TaxID=1685380 RepID=UPI0007487F94|nr:RnfH family protein [Thiomicrospira sp. WB1]KUJ71673.1 RnfH family protein [Thiomicrospira sp. WB1]